MSKFIHGPAVAGQSVVDRVLAAKHTVAGQSLAKVICKATTEEVMGPKRKHLDYLLQCTNEANVSIPEMANVLIERTQSTNWVVVFKALTTVHNLMNYGNERFTQYLASNNCSFNLSGFTDRSGTQGYDMSTFIRRYAKYLNEKALSYRLIAFDFCKVKRGKEDGILRTMDTEKLLRTLPILQAQLDVLVEFNVSANDLTNGVINAAFMLLFKDLIRLFACYNDGIINLLEKYFEMNKKNCRDALDVYKKFLLRMDRVCEFLKVAENVGIDKGDIPDLAKAPSSLLEALEQHLASLENVKKTGGVDPKVSFGMSTVISNYAVASQLGTAPGAGSGVARISDDERRKILEEEQRQLDQMKQKKQKETASAAPVTFSPSIEPTAVRTTEQPIAVNLGNSPVMPASNLREPDQFSHSVDLIGQQPDAYGLLDPFGNFDMVPRYQSNTATLASNPFASVSQQSQVVAPSWSSPSRASEQGGFDMLQPLVPSGSGLANNGDLTMKQSPDKLIKSDLDSSLASLAGNLNFRTTEQVKKKEHQWFNANETKRITGSQNTWNPSFASASHPVPAQARTVCQDSLGCHAAIQCFSYPRVCELPTRGPPLSPNTYYRRGQVVGSNSSVFLQPAVFGPTMVPQSQQMVFGQPSNLGWASGQPQAFVMPQSTAYQLHSQPKIPQTMPNDPFGSL